MGKLLMPIIVTMLPKNYSVDIAKHLPHSDFQCKCSYISCDHSLINKSLIYSHEDLVMGTVLEGLKPPQVTSGFRCYKHNHDTKGSSERSFHMQGLALDYSLRGRDNHDRQSFINLCRRYFDHVLVYKNYMHCRNSPREQ